MPSSAKDVLSETGSNAGSTSNDVGSQPNASVAEIAVTLHASRYSAASKGAAKLPPIHEDTRTVIIFPQGAVVRLSASVTPGELVVLTNNRSGTDVICRVTSVKTQPGIQNYVHLEFTQRALDFWEGASSNERGTAAVKTPVANPPAIAPPARPPVASTSKAASSVTKETQPAPKTEVPQAEIETKAPAPSPKIAPLADLPAVAPGTSAKITDARAQASEVTAAPAPGRQKPPLAFADTPRFQPFESQKSTKSKFILILVGMAAAVVVAVGIVGGPELWQRYARPFLPHDSPDVAISAPSSVPSQSNPLPTQNLAEQKPSASFESAAVKNPPVETPIAVAEPVQPAAEPAKPEPPQPVTRPALNVGRITAPKLKKVAQVNSSEPPPVLSSDPGALAPAFGQTAGSATGAALTAPEPAAPAPPQGGDLRQPKLLSSVAAVYPALARAQHVQGDVTIDALIDVTGKVSATKVLNGNLLLQNAATDALRLWKYQPARLNGEPFPIHINVTIAFHLN